MAVLPIFSGHFTIRVGMGVKVEEQDNEGGSVDDESPVHPFRTGAVDVQGLGGVKDGDHKLRLKK